MAIDDIVRIEESLTNKLVDLVKNAKVYDTRSGQYMDLKKNKIDYFGTKTEYNCDCYTCQCDGGCDCVCQSNCCDAGPCYGGTA